MSFSVAVSARTEIRTLGSENKSILKLPEVSFGSASRPIYPYQIASRIAAGDSETVDLTAFDFTKIRVLSIKSSRPVGVVMNTLTEVFILPPSTYFLHVFNSGEAISAAINEVVISVPAAPSTNPIPLPSFFPAALVEIFLACEEA